MRNISSSNKMYTRLCHVIASCSKCYSYLRSISLTKNLLCLSLNLCYDISSMPQLRTVTKLIESLSICEISRFVLGREQNSCCLTLHHMSNVEGILKTVLSLLGFLTSLEVTLFCHCKLTFTSIYSSEICAVVRI